LARSESWAPLAYRPLTAPWEPALELFRFAGAWAPSGEHIDSGWGAWDGERLAGAALTERAGASAMLHGPVVVAPADATGESALQAASELLASVLQHAVAQGIETVFTRPQGLDRIWVRHGFIPVPEAELPAALRGRAGVGLFGWRGGTALWSAAGRGAPRRSVAPVR
jgi:hypothetical protein